MGTCLQEVADSCRTGAATNIIFGLALGYQSAIVPCVVIAICIFVSFTLASMFGIACAALGMLNTLATGEQCRCLSLLGPQHSVAVPPWRASLQAIFIMSGLCLLVS